MDTYTDTGGGVNFNLAPISNSIKLKKSNIPKNLKIGSLVYQNAFNGQPQVTGRILKFYNNSALITIESSETFNKLELHEMNYRTVISYSYINKMGV
ncbi:hypothetical protein NVV78_06535 [Pediococcus ethanolidurans]|uniref:hypothetical protein n=1 Tax=Pediococcus ethanolidurans TaxID=319653 RepID=UPI0021E6E7A4|nr:hypothetical protein [Pediococcus ethanolidurans]MCV3315598.1 hypothetical protein [Pediococcus ethanolidurans]